MISVILPISHERGFENLKKTLFNLSGDLNRRVNLLAIVFNKDLFLPVRDYLQQYNNFGECLTIYSEKKSLAPTLEYLASDEYIFIWDENTLLLRNTLGELYRSYLDHPTAGFITGGVFNKALPYWVKDIYADKPKYIKNDKRNFTDDKIDVAYPFCMLTKTENFRNYYFGKERSPLAYGLKLRKAGFQNYINTKVVCKDITEE